MNEEAFGLSWGTWDLLIWAMHEVNNTYPGTLGNQTSQDKVDQLIDFMRADTDRKMQIWSLTNAGSNFTDRLTTAKTLYENAVAYVEKQ